MTTHDTTAALAGPGGFADIRATGSSACIVNAPDFKPHAFS